MYDTESLRVWGILNFLYDDIVVASGTVIAQIENGVPELSAFDNVSPARADVIGDLGEWLPLSGLRYKTG